MNNTWKLSILGAVALAASSAVMAIGCTVTTTNVTDDGGIGDDASTTDSGTADAGADSDTDSAASCPATTTCPIIGSSTGVSFDNCMACDTCAAASCCAQITQCFAQVNGMDSECSQLFTCFDMCAQPNDAGITEDQCRSNCAAAYPNGFNDALAANACLYGDGDAGTGSCSTQCQ